MGTDADDIPQFCAECWCCHGDIVNDKAMIEEFRSYAMENGVDSIKAIADFTTSGITELIKKEL